MVQGSEGCTLVVNDAVQRSENEVRNLRMRAPRALAGDAAPDLHSHANAIRDRHYLNQKALAAGTKEPHAAHGMPHKTSKHRPATITYEANAQTRPWKQNGGGSM